MEHLILLILCSVYFAVYLAFLIFASFNWHFGECEKKISFFAPCVSVIISARNEESNLPALIHSLSEIIYPRELLEIIIVDDQSTDHTKSVLEALNFKYGLNIRILSTIYSSTTPKRDALNLGIKSSSGEILLFTDADCTVGKNWIRSVISGFSANVDLVFGPIRYYSANYLEKLLSAEQAALLGSAAASLKLGIPTMCNGANMAVRKSAFDQINGFDSSSNAASGDDELLLHKMFTRNSRSVLFIKCEDAVINTQPVRTFYQLFHQRKRWAGKWEKYTLKKTKLFAVSVFGFHMSWILFMISTLSMYPVASTVIIFALKALFEYVLIVSVMKFQSKRLNLPSFVLLQFIYSFYVVFFGLISRGSAYRWKERKLN